jgi:enterochelin esterase-like enzyme
MQGNSPNMNKFHAALIAALFSSSFIAPAALAQAICPPRNASVPAGANMTNPSAPFFIDTSGMNLNTQPPTRNPANPNYPLATELAEGKLPSTSADGNFIIGPAHPAAPETVAQNGVPKGTVYSFTMSSKDSVIYNPGMVREDPQNCLNASISSASTAAGDLSNLIVTTSHAGTWTRTVDVYVPAGYVRGTEAAFIVVGDGGPTGFFSEKMLFTVLDNLIHQHRLPPMIAVSISAGGQDAQGSERGREYDMVSGAYAEWVEREVLPLAEQHAKVRLTKNPDDRATMGISSSGAAAFTMAWFHPELYHRVLAYSPTMVNQQWPHDTALPGGAWEYHDSWTGPAKPNLNVSGVNVTNSDLPIGSPLIPNTPRKPIRYWFETGDQDLFYPLPPLADGMHDWTLANERMAKVLADKGYHYQFLFSRNATHVDKPTVAQTLPEALEWVWKGYSAPQRHGS